MALSYTMLPQVSANAWQGRLMQVIVTGAGFGVVACSAAGFSACFRR